MMTYEKLLEKTALEDDRFIVMTAEKLCVVESP